MSRMPELGDKTQQALAMLDVFESVGAACFALTLTDLGGRKTDYRSDCSIDILRDHISFILSSSSQGKKNVIVRPKPAQNTLIQLDDLAAEAITRLKSASFLTLLTSPGSYQVWLAVADADTEFPRRVKLGTGADASASGATRIAGSVNFKPKYAPDFPTVQMLHAAAGLVVERSELEALGIVAALPVQQPPRHASSRRGLPKRFPDYAECLRKAPRRRDGQCDRSKADFFFCYLAAKWGWAAAAIAAELLRVSAKAQEKGAGYALLTAQNAADNAGKHGGGA